MQLRNALCSLFAFTAPLVTFAEAGTFVIDDDGGVGVDFQDIQSAILAANHGDILIVRDGDYAGFTLDRGLTIIAAETNFSANIDSTITITGVPNPRRALLSGLITDVINITSNPGHVILDHVVTYPPLGLGAGISINQCEDVRLYECTVTMPWVMSREDVRNGVQVVNSRFEAIDCYFEGAEGWELDDCWSSNPVGGNGSDGVWATSGSFVALFSSSCVGGWGGSSPKFCEWTDADGGDGGDGLFLRGASRAVVVGESSDTLAWGPAGYGEAFDGNRGTGLVLNGGSAVRISGVTVTNHAIQAGSVMTTPVLDDPFLQRTGLLKAGEQQTFTIHGQPGDVVTFYIGRSPTITVDPLQEMDDLVSHERAYTLGVIPPSGRKTFVFTIPTWFPTAFHFFVQAATTNSSGERLLTNSMPIVLRELP